ncbi:hypothetical protein D3C76_1401150 [compost metagenome]
MQISAEDLPILAHGAVAAAIVQLHGRALQRRATGDTGVDLVTADRCLFKQQAATHVAQLFFGLKRRAQIQKPQARA